MFFMNDHLGLHDFLGLERQFIVLYQFLSAYVVYHNRDACQKIE